MKIDELINRIYDKDDSQTYIKMQELEKMCLESSNIYKYINEFVQCIDNEKSYIRIRAITFISANAKWDKDDIINKNIDKILKHIEDEKPIVSRKYIQGLKNIATYKKKLIPIIKEKLEEIDFDKYKESMSSLLKRDSKKLLDFINEKR